MGCLVKEVCTGGYSQQYITFASDHAMGPNELKGCYEQLLSRLDSNRMQIVWEKAFGNLQCRDWVARCRKECLPEKYSKHPFTYLEGAPVHGDGLAGITLYVIGGGEAEYITREGRTIGAKYHLDGSSRLYLSSSAGEDTGSAAGDFPHQFSSATQRMQDALEHAGFGWRDVVRTWFYLGHIQRDYPRFNTLRRDLFDTAGIDYCADSNDLPASTCIEGAVPYADCSIELLCCDKQAVTLHRIYNPGQNEAEGVEYLHRPTFSRAMLLRTSRFCELQISGTASIDAQGRSVHLSDPARQIAWTLENIRNLLNAAKMDFSNIAEATCFFKHAQDARYFQTACEDLGIASFPHIKVQGNVCRDDLLFEIDGIALK